MPRSDAPPGFSGNRPMTVQRCTTEAENRWAVHAVSLRLYRQAPAHGQRGQIESHPPVHSRPHPSADTPAGRHGGVGRSSAAVDAGGSPGAVRRNPRGEACRRVDHRVDGSRLGPVCTQSFQRVVVGAEGPGIFSVPVLCSRVRRHRKQRQLIPPETLPSRHPPTDGTV